LLTYESGYAYLGGEWKKDFAGELVYKAGGGFLAILNNPSHLDGRQSQRFCSGDTPVPVLVGKMLDLLPRVRSSSKTRQRRQRNHDRQNE
jgi:hypothetical protein